jgi:hypothetical protein
MSVNSALRGRDLTRSEELRRRRAREISVVEEAPREPRRKVVRRRAARRRVNLALPIEVGAEVSLPALPVLKAGARLLSAVLLACLLLWLQQVLSKDRFQVARAEVSGAQFLGESKARSVAQVDGTSVFLVDPAAVARRLEALPEVVKADVKVRWPNGVSIQIQERHPMIAWDDAGRVWWISEDGIAFLERGYWPGLVRVTSQTPVLRISGDPRSRAIDPEIVTLAAALSARLPQTPTLTYDAVHGLGYEDPRGWVAYFGAEGDMLVKVRVYLAIVDQLLVERRQPALISVEDASVPYYRLAR